MTVRGAEKIDTGWLLTIRNVAARMEVSPRTVERLIAGGKLPHVRPTPSMIRVHPADLRAYLETRHQEAAPAPSAPSSASPRPSRRRHQVSARPSFIDELKAVER